VEDILYGRFRKRAIVRDPQGDRVDQRAIAIIDRPECPFITLADLYNQLAIHLWCIAGGLVCAGQDCDIRSGVRYGDGVGVYIGRLDVHWYYSLCLVMATP
jgi:hypothetical protein